MKSPTLPPADAMKSLSSPVASRIPVGELKLDVEALASKIRSRRTCSGAVCIRPVDWVVVSLFVVPYPKISLDCNALYLSLIKAATTHPRLKL